MADLQSAAAPRQAFRAVVRLSAVPKQAVPLLSKHLRPVTIKPEDITRLIADLDSDRFAVRQKATTALEGLGRDAEVALEKALARKPPLETSRRIEHILDHIRKRDLTAEELLWRRSVEVLERVGTPEARQVLQKLAAGTPDAAQTEDARESLERLERRAGRR